MPARPGPQLEAEIVRAVALAADHPIVRVAYRFDLTVLHPPGDGPEPADLFVARHAHTAHQSLCRLRLGAVDHHLIDRDLGRKDLAPAVDPAGQVVVQANGTKVAIYSKEGEYLAEVDKALVVTGVPILACDARTDHVLVRLTDQRAVWVDRLEVEVRSAQAAKARECKDTGVARPADQTTPATSGIDPCRH